MKIRIAYFVLGLGLGLLLASILDDASNDKVIGLVIGTIVAALAVLTAESIDCVEGGWG